MSGKIAYLGPDNKQNTFLYVKIFKNPLLGPLKIVLKAL